VPATRAVIVTGVAAVLTAVAATGWILVHKSPGTHKTSTGTHRTAGAPAPAAATAPTPTPVTTHASPAANLRALKPVSATPFDPYGSGQGENSDLAPRAIDTSPATAWHTQWYTTARFGNLKPGTGLLLDMGHKVTISGVRLLLGRDPGESLVAAAFADYVNVSRRHATVSMDDGGHATIRDENSTNGTFVNGDRVLPGISVRLADGDVVRLAADVSAEVVLPRQEPDPAWLTRPDQR